MQIPLAFVLAEAENEDMKNIVHRFEERGLGIAPFRFVRFYESKYCACPGAPVQPGTSCDYCGTGIMGVYVIKDCNGKEFKVGCECVKKTDDAGLIDTVKRAQAKHRQELKYEARKVLVTTLRDLVAQNAIQKRLTMQPHPNSYFAEQGKTRLDYVEYMILNGGDDIRKALIKELVP
jgi:hypothetical protein